MFEGLSVAMVTPFRDDDLDLEATDRLVEFLISGGVEHLVVSGSTGEAATCSVEERRTLWRFVKVLLGRRPEMSSRQPVGASSSFTRDEVGFSHGRRPGISGRSLS